MVTLSNADISRIFKVTRATVTNWVTNATNQDNALQLVTYNGKVQVVKNEHNLAELHRLKTSGKKHSNKSFYLEIVPKKEFYELFSESQIIEIINSLKTSKEIALKYTYLNKGAKIWDEYHTSSIKRGEYPATQKESKMLCQSFEFLKDRFDSFEKLNIIDIGPGNGLLIKDFIMLLQEANKIDKYIVVDISEEMNQIALSNVKEWCPNLQSLSYIRDIEVENIADVVLKNKKDGGKVANIVLLAGGTLGSISDRRQCLKNLRNSVDEEDILIITTKLDNLTERVELAHIKDKFSRLLWPLSLLGIDTDNCDVIRKYDEHIKAKTAYLVLDRDYVINFEIGNSKIPVTLNRGEEILIWQFHLSTISEIYLEMEQSKLRVIQLLTAKKYEYILVSCESMF